jgi:NADPH2:quinone reductase
MKAAVYYETGKPDVFKYEDRDDPPLAATGVMIKVEAISIEGGDVLNRAGGEMPSKPHIVGYQCAGTITAVGDSVTDRKVGDRVVATMPFGSHAELVSVSSMQTWPLPDGMDIREGACVPVAYGTAHDCLFEFGRLQAREKFLAQGGAGGVGLAMVQLAKRAGATVLATAGSDEKLERLKEYGLDHGVNYREDDWVAKVKSLSGGGVDLVVDPVGTTLGGSIQATGYKGRIVVVGNAGHPGVLSEMNRSLTGVFFGGSLMMERPRSYPMVQGLIDDIAKGEIKVVIDREFPLSEAAAAHAYIESRQAFGRVLLIP